MLYSQSIAFSWFKNKRKITVKKYLTLAQKYNLLSNESEKLHKKVMGKKLKTMEEYYRQPQWIDWLVSGSDIRRCDVKIYPPPYIVDSIQCHPSSNICRDRSRQSGPVIYMIEQKMRMANTWKRMKLASCLYQLRQNNQSYTVEVARLVEWRTVNAWELSRWS